MSDLPLTYFQLNATYEGLVADTGDPGLSPDFFNVYMDLTLTPRIEGAKSDAQLLLTGLTPPVTALLIPIPASVQNGVLVLPRQSAPSNQINDPTQSSILGLRLWAKSSLLGVGSARLLYDVTFGQCSVYGKQYRFDPFTFAAPEIEPPMPYVVSIVGTPAGGTWTAKVLALGVTGIAAGIDVDASAVELAAALGGLGNVGVGNVSVTGPDGGPYAVTFGGALSGLPIGLSGDGSTLSGGDNAGVVADAVVSTVVDLTTVARVTNAPT